MLKSCLVKGCVEMKNRNIFIIIVVFVLGIGFGLFNQSNQAKTFDVSFIERVNHSDSSVNTESFSSIGANLPNH